MGLTIAALLLAVVALAGCGLALSRLRQLSSRMEQALQASTGQSLEATLANHHKHVTQVDDRLAELEKNYADLVITNSVASQKISVVRYNPFGDTGGDQSFSLAVLDGHNSGYVLTSIHGRQGTRVYLKPIDYGKGKHSLSDEEAQAIQQAIHRIPTLPSQNEQETNS
ncbi:MAG TPA: DUF4446 family protein [Candidatus Saccharimonadia bacterium]